MPIQVAQLVAKVSADTSGAEKGLNGVAGLLGKALPIAALGGVAAVAGIGIAAVKMAGDFQAGMTSLVTGAGESQSNIKMVSDGILNMATATGTSTQQLTDGMFMIESAGYHGKAGLDVLKAAAEGAKVGNADLGTTADALTTILKDYPDVTNGASGAMNTLIATVASGKTHMADLAAAMSQILPTSSAAGVGLNDVMGAMATMTGEGVPAANAATYLRQTILALDAPSKAAQKALANFGLSSSDVASEMQKSLPDALKMITDAVGKKFPVGSAAYVAALKDISGGSKQMQGIVDLTSTHMSDFKNNVAGVTDQVKKGGTSIVGWSDVQKDFNFKMDRAKEVVETLMIKIGTGLLPVAGKIVDLFSTYFVPTLMAIVGGLLAVVSTGGRFVSWLEGTGPAATAVKGILLLLGGAMLGFAASAIPAAVTAIASSVVAFGAQAVAAGAAAVATIAAAAPFILVGIAIAGVIGIIILIVTHIKEIGQWFDKLKIIIRSAVENILGMLSHIPGPIGAMASSVLAGMKSADDATQVHTLAMKVAADQHTAQMAQAAVMHTDRMRQGLLEQIKNTTDPAKKKVLEMRLAVVEHTEQMQREAVQHAVMLAAQHKAQMERVKQDAIRQAREAKLGFLGHMGEMKDSAIQFSKNLAMGVLGKLIDLKNWVVAKAEELKSGFITKVSDLVTGVVNFFTSLPGKVLGALSSLPGDLLNFGMTLMQKLAAGIASGAGAIAGALKNIPVIGGAIGGLGNLLPHFATGGTMGGTGLAIVGENGPELVQMPGGAQITPLAQGQSVSGIPAGMMQAYGLGTATQGGQMLPLTIYLDGVRVAQIVTRLQPDVIRNGTGSRGF
ncbi:MAG: phage tail tape measure protein [Rhodospirillales bacterium]|nr:phage tail tape measure protein [Rhodospirillales bacterium]